MGRFTFPKSRKKSPPQLVLAEPMSKAHKILGSTPISIDSPKPWDDASSGFSGGTGDSTAPSYNSTEDDASDHHVAIASSEDEWTNDPGILPAILESSGLESDTDNGISDMARSIRKTQSSSTIRSWYDMSQQPMSVTQQASASSMAKGVPAKIHKMLDLESQHVGPKVKKKPPMLDFSNLRSASRLSRKTSNTQLRTDGTMVSDAESAVMSPALSLITPAGKTRKIQKRNTRDVMSPATEEARPHTTGGTRRASYMKEVPSLYDHYEQMTMRHLMHEDAKGKEGGQPDKDTEPKDKKAPEKAHEEPGGARDLLWLHDAMPTTPRTAFMTGLTPAAARERLSSNTSKMTAPSRRPKSADRPDLQETSMLMLSSDSEDDDQPAALPKKQPTSPNRRPSTASVSPRTVSRSASSRAPSQASDYRPARNSKRTSFAPANTYITIPNSSRLSTDTAIPIGIDSRSSTPYTEGPSCRSSLMSTSSSASHLQNSSNFIQEARAVTMVAGRRPSRVEYGDESSPDGSIPPSTLSTMSRRYPGLTQTPPEQLTPPLSPTSVDFYIRSARSSIDGPGSQNRFMAVTRQEEMLLSALRHKKQHTKEQSEMVQEQYQKSKEDEPLELDESDGIQETELFASEAMFDFGFPAPPTARKQSFFGNEDNAPASISSRTSTATTDKISQSSFDEDYDGMLDSRQSSLAPAPVSQVPLKSILKRPSFQQDEPEQQEVILYLEDAEPLEPSPDMTDFSEFGYLAMPSLQSEHSENSLRSLSPNSDSFLTHAQSSRSEGKRIDRGYRSPSAMASVPEDSELSYEEAEDIPRPDSPISPDAFPAVPQIRTTLSSMARLSAVGPAPMMSEPGWWGDDD